MKRNGGRSRGERERTMATTMTRTTAISSTCLRSRSRSFLEKSERSRKTHRGRFSLLGGSWKSSMNVCVRTKAKRNRNLLGIATSSLRSERSRRSRSWTDPTLASCQAHQKRSTLLAAGARDFKNQFPKWYVIFLSSSSFNSILISNFDFRF